MRLAPRGFPALLFLLLSTGRLLAADPSANVPLTGLLPEVDFFRLSQRDPNPLGEKALSMHPELWKHAETEHFIYHFVSAYLATPVSQEAEFYYQAIAQELQRNQPVTNTKSHIYVFESGSDWAQFQTLGRLEPWSGGIHSQGSLFIRRDQNYNFVGSTLGHEIAHLILHRFYPDGIPCWLDEGFAQYFSKCARATYRRARGFDAKSRSQSIAPQDLIPITSLVVMTQPPFANVETFYNESERLVRFLVSTDKAGFLVLLDLLASHQPFEVALLRVYNGKFSSLADFEQKFRDNATKDFGSSIQDAPQ